MSTSNIPEGNVKKPATIRRPPLTPWELPSLLTPMYEYRRSKRKAKIDRSHFPAILGYVYRNRFAVASQIQRRFAGVLRSDRTARRHLAEMESLGYLATAPTRSTSPLFPKVYFVTRRGISKLRRALPAKNKPGVIGRIDRSLRQGYSAEHVIHELLVTEFLLAVWQSVEAHPDLQLLAVQRRSLERHSGFRVTCDSGPTRLKPDAMFLYRHSGHGMACCFLEMDTGSMSVPQVSAKYRRYLAWWQTKTAQDFLIDLYRRHGAIEPRAAFRVLVVGKDRCAVSDDRRLDELIRAADGLARTITERLWFTTVTRLREQHNSRWPLSAPVWIKGAHRPAKLETIPKRRLIPPPDARGPSK